jgi:hypothetical protein
VDILKAIGSMEVIDSGSSNLIAAMCDEVRLVETIDGMGPNGIIIGVILLQGRGLGL